MRVVVADRIVFMAEGRVIEEGAPEVIPNRPREKRTRKFLRHLAPDPHLVPEPSNRPPQAAPMAK